MTSKTSSTTPIWLWGFIVLIALLPLPFGTNRPWSADLMGIIAALLTFLMLGTEKNSTPWQTTTSHKRLLTAAFGLFIVILWSFIQTIPWTPVTWHHPIWQEAAQSLGTLTGAISVDPTLYIESIVRLLSYIALFLIAFVAGSNIRHAERLIKCLAFAGAAYAAYGVIMYASGTEMILWYKKWAYNTFLTSTFVNKNSYAAYAGLSLLCSLAYLRERLKDKWQKHIAHKTKLITFMETLSWRDWAIILMPLLILAALSLTGSRAGTISTLFGVVVLFGGLSINKRRKSQRHVMMSLFVLLGFVGFVLLGGHTLITRFNIDTLGQDAEIRIAAYKLALQAITDNPWLGFGLGTFDSAFRLYRDARLSIWFHHAHNDYLEMIMDLGVPAAITLFSSIALLISCCLSGIWNRKRNAIYPALGFSASTLIIVHSMFDFSMHIPAIAGTYAVLLGLAVAQSWSSRTT